MKNEIIKFLVIDDEEKARNQWENIITEYGNISNYHIFKEKNGSNVIELLTSNNDLKIIFIDKFLGDNKEDGLTIANKIKENFSHAFIILVTSFGIEKNSNTRKPEIVTALQNGIIDYFIVKDDVHFHDEMFKARDAAIKSINHPNIREQITKERLNILIKDFNIDPSDYEKINKILVGKSKATQDLKKWIVKFAKSNDPIPVLITGETGTGKEVVANLIHQLSNRSHKTLRPVNCAAISEELIESELFGHVKGAFTGAIHDKDGQFLMAKDSTLFLDEIGELSLSAQAKILRAIQERKVDKVGGQEYKVKSNSNNYYSEEIKTKNEIDIDVNVRIICATNKDLKNIVEKEINNKSSKEFRPDLFYRLSGFHIKLLPLRDRLEDIPDLVEYFTLGKSVVFTPKSIDTISTEYNWPGNIRELKSFIDSLSNLFPEKSPFEVELIKEALELWKGMQPQTNFMFSNINPSINSKEQKTVVVVKKHFKQENLDETEKRLRILIFAMTHNKEGEEIDHIETNLKILAQLGNSINSDEKLRNLALLKMEESKRTMLKKGFSKNASALSAWFSDTNTKEKIKDVIKKHQGEMELIKSLTPYINNF